MMNPHDDERAQTSVAKIAALLEKSSLGTPAAQAARARTPLGRAQRIARVKTPDAVKRVFENNPVSPPLSETVLAGSAVSCNSTVPIKRLAQKATSRSALIAATSGAIEAADYETHRPTAELWRARPQVTDGEEPCLHEQHDRSILLSSSLVTLLLEPWGTQTSFFAEWRIRSEKLRADTVRRANRGIVIAETVGMSVLSTPGSEGVALRRIRDIMRYVSSARAPDVCTKKIRPFTDTLATVETWLGMAADTALEQQMVLSNECFYGASVGSGGWYMPFADPNPRVERWWSHPVCVNSGGVRVITHGLGAVFVTAELARCFPNQGVFRRNLQEPRAFGDEGALRDFGMLLRGALDRLPAIRQAMIVDADCGRELTYLIAHHECGHVLFGGVCGTDIGGDDEALDDHGQIDDYIDNAIYLTGDVGSDGSSTPLNAAEDTSSDKDYLPILLAARRPGFIRRIEPAIAAAYAEAMKDAAAMRNAVAACHVEAALVTDLHDLGEAVTSRLQNASQLARQLVAEALPESVERIARFLDYCARQRAMSETLVSEPASSRQSYSGDFSSIDAPTSEHLQRDDLRAAGGNSKSFFINGGKGTTRLTLTDRDALLVDSQAGDVGLNLLVAVADTIQPSLPLPSSMTVVVARDQLEIEIEWAEQRLRRSIKWKTVTAQMFSHAFNRISESNDMHPKVKKQLQKSLVEMLTGELRRAGRYL